MCRILVCCLLVEATISQAQVNEPGSLETGAWQLVQIQSMDDRQWIPTAHESYTLEFRDSGNLVLETDCNYGSGSWSSEGQSQLQLSVDSMKNTECAPGPLQDRLLRELSFVRSYVFRDSRLYLATMADSSIIEFRQAKIAPSFDCSMTTASVESMVCEEADLAILDRRLDFLYRKALAIFPEEEISVLKAYQRGWIKGRNDCWKSDGVMRCVTDEYRRRITELQIAVADQLVPAAIVFSCDDGQTASAYFYNDTEIPALVLDRHPSQEILYREVSASGARYTGRNVMFWQKGTAARLEWDGRESRCQRVDTTPVAP